MIGLRLLPQHFFAERSARRFALRLHVFWPRLVPHSAEPPPTRCKERRLVPAMALVEGLASTFFWVMAPPGSVFFPFVHAGFILSIK